ncbi:MAG: hypothetical protein V7752_20705 [Halopseudomonas sp.]
MFDLPRTGMVIEAPDENSAEPGSPDDYNRQQYRRLQATGTNCSGAQFAQWFVEIQGGTLCGDEGLILDFGDVPDSCLNNTIELHWDDLIAAKYGPRKESDKH